MKIEVKYHDPELIPLSISDKGDWIDLRAAEDVTITPGGFKLISLGVSMKLPEGYEAVIIPRSSTFKTWGIMQTNHFGLIDNSYCGDDDVWMFPAYAVTWAHIKKNDRICQFRIQKKMDHIEFETVEHLEGVNRGGFGSTGTK